jgi:hypothetical protein
MLPLDLGWKKSQNAKHFRIPWSTIFHIGETAKSRRQLSEPTIADWSQSFRSTASIVLVGIEERWEELSMTIHITPGKGV